MSVAPAAYWASWADCIHMIHQRHPELAVRIVETLEQPGESVPACLQELLQSETLLQSDGMHCVASWRDLLLQAGRSRGGAGGTDPPNSHDESEGWVRGSQRRAMLARGRAELDSLWHNLDRTSRALLLSQSGPLAGKVLTVIPAVPETTMNNSHFRTILLRRLRLPLDLTPSRCRCHGLLDVLGDHRAACPTAGVLGNRGVPLEKMAARVCREAGARVTTNTYVRDLNLDVIRRDDRRIEVIANGLPLWNGAQIAVDTTLVSPVKRNGQPQPHTADRAGAWLDEARRRKENTYPELTGSRRCRLTVLGAEVGGRWSEESLRFLRLLARARARTAPEGLRAATGRAFLSRWSGFLAVAAQRSFAASLLGEPLAGASCVDGAVPDLSEVLDDSRFDVAPDTSRLPAR